MLTPDTEAEIPHLVRECIELGLTIIPRGGGTGYTGRRGAAHSLVRRDQHREARRPGQRRTDPAAGHGSRERRACSPRPAWSPAASAKPPSATDLVFAVDPTSADACCIGGNIAMNAGGKKAVLWGTAVDNLAWWRMVDPEGNWLEVTRLDHNLGKIHDAPIARFELVWKDGRAAAGAGCRFCAANSSASTARSSARPASARM